MIYEWRAYHVMPGGSQEAVGAERAAGVQRVVNKIFKPTAFSPMK